MGDVCESSPQTNSSQEKDPLLVLKMRVLLCIVPAFAILLAAFSEADANHMVDSSLGCADGSRCWCFMQRGPVPGEGMATLVSGNRLFGKVTEGDGPCIT